MATKQDFQADQWDEFVISDFTGGITSQGFNAQTGPKFPTAVERAAKGSKVKHRSDPVPPKFGGLSPANKFEFIPIQNQVTGNSFYTFGCIGLPTGGLAPMPLRTTALTVPYSSSFPTTDTTDTVGIVGFYSNPIGRIYSSQQFTELIIVSELPDTATNIRYIQVASYNNSGGFWSGNEILNANFTPGGSLQPGYSFVRPFLTRMANITTVPTNWETPGVPVIIVGWSCIESSGMGILIAYPNPTTPTVLSNLSIKNGSNTGDTFGHQGRVVQLTHFSDSWPYGALQKLSTNDRVDFTDPPNSFNTTTTTMGNQHEIFAEEFPYGYGCWGSINAGELLLIKNRGGGVVVSGDLFSPQVIFVPGIKDTGGYSGLAAVTPDGLVYCSGGGGAWIWAGSNEAQKISSALDDYFFQYSTLQNFAVSTWQSFYLFPNNWAYDTITGGWWLLVDNQNSLALPNFPVALKNIAYMQYTTDAAGQIVYAAPGLYTVANRATTTIDQFNRAIGANVYQWQSQPIMLADDRIIEIEELVFHVTGQTGSTIGIYIAGINNTNFQHSFTIPAAYGATFVPYTARVKVGNTSGGAGGPLQVDQLELGVWAQGQGSNYAPIINDITVRYSTGQTHPYV